MLLIACPFCGPRDEIEFVYGGQGHLARPPLTADDAEWSRYLFERDNARGPHAERWVHRHGCGRWFNVVRDTVTHEVVEAMAFGDGAPGVGDADVAL